MSTFSVFLFLLCIVLAPCLAILSTVFAKRKIHNKPQKMRQRRLLILFCVLLIIPFVIAVLVGLGCGNMQDSVEFLKKNLFSGYYAGFIVLALGFFLYAFFRKDKETDK